MEVKKKASVCRLRRMGFCDCLRAGLDHKRLLRAFHKDRYEVSNYGLEGNLLGRCAAPGKRIIKRSDAPAELLNELNEIAGSVRSIPNSLHGQRAHTQ